MTAWSRKTWTFCEQFLRFFGKKDPSQTVATARIAPKVCRASPHIYLTLFQISTKSVHFRRSYCRTREDRFWPIDLQNKLFEPIKTRPNFTRFSVHVTCGRGSVLVSRQFTKLYTSRFVNDVMFAYKGGNRPADCRSKDDAYVSSNSPDGGTRVKSAVSDCILFSLHLNGLPFVHCQCGQLQLIKFFIRQIDRQ